MDKIFGTQAPAAPAPAPVVAPQPQGNIPSEPSIVAIEGNPTSPAIPASPLDQYSTLWDTDPTKKAEEGYKQLTSEQVTSAMSKADFAQNLDPAWLEAISAGGEGATAALPQILNAMARQVMTQSTLVNSKVTQQQVDAAVAKQQGAIPALLRQQQATDHLKSTNPLFDNPAIKPVMEAARDQLLLKHPNATTAEITEMTHNFVTTLGESFAPVKEVTKAPDDIDWDAYISQ